MSIVISSLISLLWILVFYNIGGLRTPWFTIFIDLDQVNIILFLVLMKILYYYTIYQIFLYNRSISHFVISVLIFLTLFTNFILF